MANWIITHDLLSKAFGCRSAVGVGSCGIAGIDKATLTETFRLYDDDGALYFEGRSDDSTSQSAFDPLDNFGQPDAGCCRIDYLNETTGKFETL